ncbi:MAG: hemolysin [Brevundimonas sp.]|nr:hemolysin [Brevundimonas sp.]
MKIQIFGLAVAGLLAAACAPVETGPAPMPPGDGLSQCRADQYRRYIGRNRSELPPRPAGEAWRVTCSTLPVTMDYNHFRLIILYYQSSWIIR